MLARLKTNAAFWWAIWVVALLVSMIPPAVHELRGIEELIEPLRYPWGLLPVHWLFLRHLGEMSLTVPVIVLSAGVLSFWWAERRREIFGLVFVGAIGALAVYTAYCVTLLSLLIVHLTENA